MLNDWGRSVLEQYELEITEVRRGKGALICETNQGLKLLQSISVTEKHLQEENQILHALKEQGFSLVDEMVPNKEGNLISEDVDRCRYVLKDWFDGNECSVFRYGDLMVAVQSLAMLHEAFQRICESGAEKEEMAIRSESLGEELERHNRELRRIRNYIKKTGKKTTFELCVMKSFDEMFDQAAKAELRMKESACQALYEQAAEKGMLCHGNFHYHNVLIVGEKGAVINFHKYAIQLPLVDLYKFMRKVLEKHNWSIDLGKKMLYEYRKVRKISPEELEVLGILFAYPEKYWKQMNNYYNSNKAWIPEKNIDKLEKCVEQDRLKQKFTEKVFGIR